MDVAIQRRRRLAIHWTVWVLGAQSASKIASKSPTPYSSSTGIGHGVKSDACPDGLRTTYVCGEVLIEISPEALERHNKIKTAMTVAIAWFVQERDLGEVYSDRALVTHEPAGLSLEPDLTFVTWASFEQGHVRLVEKAGTPRDYVELVGSPDLVLEIVSDSSVRKDRTLLRDAYGRAGVREYWLIDARGHDWSSRFWRITRGFFARRRADSIHKRVSCSKESGR
jgi:Uma2 family endonuclease